MSNTALVAALAALIILAGFVLTYMKNNATFTPLPTRVSSIQHE